eukprot:364430_1
METEENIQQSIDIEHTKPSSLILNSFEIAQPKNTDDSLDVSLIHQKSPLHTGVGNYFESDSLTSSQIIKPVTATQRKSTLLQFVEQNQASIFSSCMNLSNTILGAGLLGLPYAISKTGYFLAIILFIIMAVLSFIGLNLSCSAAKIWAPNASYYTLSDKSVPRAKKLVDFAVAIKCFGVGTSYFVVIGDLLPDVMKEFLPAHLENSAWTNRQLWITIFSLLFIVPVIRFKNMDALRFTSVVAIICFIYVTIIVILYASNTLDANIDPHIDKQLAAFPLQIISFLKVIPIYIFAFTCHQNSFTITNELKDNKLRRLNMVIVNSLGLCVITYCIVGYSGYFTYGVCVESDILKSYPRSISVAIVRIVLSIALAWSYPLQCHPCRKCLCSLFWDKNINKIDYKMFYILTYSIFFGSFFISMIVDDLSIVLEIVGSVGSPIISFILPGLFYYKMTNPKLKYQDNYQIKRKIAFAYIVFGCCIIPFTLSMQFVPVKDIGCKI